MDATDYLKTPEAQAQLDLTLDRLRLDISTHPEKYQDSRGNPDPAKMEAERARRFLAVREELMYDLPDEYLSPEELREREERKPPHRWEDE